MGAHIYGITFAAPCVLATCHHNALNALVKRHITEPPNQLRITLNPALYHEIRRTNARSGNLKYYQDMGLWKARRTQIKLAAIEESHLYDELKLDQAKSFIKREVNARPPSKARLIQGHVNERTAYNHPDWYRAIAKVLTHITLEDDGVEYDFTYAGGMNHDQIADWFEQASSQPGAKCYDERDGKNWDSTMQEGHLRYEAQIYALFDEDVAREFLKRSAGVRGKIRCLDALVVYYTAWKRLSGDWNTSIGNTIISMIIVLTAVGALPKHLRPRRVRGIFMGDDYVGVYYYDQLPCLDTLTEAMNHNEALCGITPVRGITTDVYLVEFISLTLWPTKSGGVAAVPKVSNVLSKLFASVKPLSKHIRSDVLATITALEPSFHGFELMQRFFAHHRRAWEHVPAKMASKGRCSTFFNDYDFSPTRRRDVNWIYGFIHKYNIPITCFDFDFREFRGLQACIVSSYIVDLLYEKEHTDPDVRLARH